MNIDSFSLKIKSRSLFPYFYFSSLPLVKSWATSIMDSNLYRFLFIFGKNFKMMVLKNLILKEDFFFILSGAILFMSWVVFILALIYSPTFLNF